MLITCLYDCDDNPACNLLMLGLAALRPAVLMIHGGCIIPNTCASVRFLSIRGLSACMSRHSMQVGLG